MAEKYNPKEEAVLMEMKKKVKLADSSYHFLLSYVTSEPLENI